MGASLYTAARVAKLFGMVKKEDWPYNASIWPPIEPSGLDEKATPYRIHHYFRVRNESEIKHTLAAGIPVSISTPIFSQWYKAENGVIQFPEARESILERHAVLIIGYRENEQYFHFVNSWGKKWGDDGYGWLPYGFFDQYGIDAIAMPGFLSDYYEGNPYTKSRGFLEIRWGLPTPSRNLIHGMTIVDAQNKQEVAWAYAYIEENTVDVEEFFVSPRYRHQGFAHSLFKMLRDFSEENKRPLRILVPNIDSLLLGQNLHDIAWKFGLRVEESKVPWASKCLVQ